MRTSLSWGSGSGSKLSRNPNEEHSGPIFHFMENFENLSASSSDGSVVLRLRHGVRLSCERIYLLVLTLHGGASLVGTGGQEFVSVRRSGGEEEVLFKFENYKHKTDKPGQTTSVEQGLVEKIFFNL